MFSLRNIMLVLAIFSAFATLTPAAVSAQTKLQTRLTGNTLASGKAKFELKGSRLKFSTEVEDAARSVTMIVVVTRGSALVGSWGVKTSALGSFDLNLDSSLGQKVPKMAAGDRISVLQGGRVIVGGTLR